MRTRRFDLWEGLAGTLSNLVLAPLMNALAQPARAAYLVIGHAHATLGLFLLIGITLAGAAGAWSYYQVNTPIAEVQASRIGWDVAHYAADYRKKLRDGTYVASQWTMLGITKVGETIELEFPVVGNRTELRAEVRVWSGGSEPRAVLRSWPIPADTSLAKAVLPIAELPEGTSRAEFRLKQVGADMPDVALSTSRVIEWESEAP